MAKQERGSENGEEVSWQDSPYWSDKGAPKEQFDITFSGRKIEMANFSEAKLTKDQLGDLEKIIAEFSQIKNGEVFDKIKSICVDNEQPTDPETGKGLNGMAVEKGDGIIKLYPRALEPIPHRVEGVSNFEGTVIHEFSHAIALVEPEINDEWRKKFGWKKDEKKIEEIYELGLMDELKETPQKDWGAIHPNIWVLTRIWNVAEPRRCVTDYAKLGPEDDFAESMVAALRNPEVLDTRRRVFLKNRVLADVNEKTAAKVDVLKRLGE